MSPGETRDPSAKCLVYAILCIVALNSVVLVDFVGEGVGYPYMLRGMVQRVALRTLHIVLPSDSRKPRTILVGDTSYRVPLYVCLGTWAKIRSGVYVYGED